MTEELEHEQVDLWHQGDGKSRTARTAKILSRLSHYCPSGYARIAKLWYNEPPLFCVIDFDWKNRVSL
jgi:hypothetical protein